MRKRLWFAPGRETAGLLRRSFSVAAIALCLGAGGAAAAECDAPDPGLVIAPPASSISPDAAAFSGVWAGTWR